MKFFLKHEEGSILGIAMIYFLIFSITGMAVLTLAAHWRTTTQEEVHVIKNRYAVESILNLALWRINQGPDSLANFVEDGAASLYNDSTMKLIVNTSRWGKPYQLSVELEFDDAFFNPISFNGITDTTNITLPPGYEYQVVDSLPQIDLNYYYDNADSLYSGNQSFNDAWPTGIHYCDSGMVTLNNNFHLVGTLLVLDELKVVGTNVLIQAGQDSLGNYLPALILGGSASATSVTDFTVEGAIYSLGDIDINKGFFTGPLICANLDVQNELTIDPTGAEQYYSYPPGFEDPDTTSLDKRIKAGTWRN